MNKNFLNRLFTGLIIITVGVVFLLNQTGYVDISIGQVFSNFWPVIIIFFGIQALLTSGGSRFWGGFMILLGIVFLGRELDWFHWSIGDLVKYIWPIIIIIVGINLIWKPKSRKNQPPSDDWKSYRPFENENPVPPAPPLHPDPTKQGEANSFEEQSEYDGHKKGINLNKDDYSEWDDDSYKSDYKKYKHDYKKYKEEYKRYKHDYKNHKEHVEWWNHGDSKTQTRSGFIGDIHIGDDYWDLKPLNVSHFIGDTVLDLTKAQVAPGETKINISSFIGDVKVYVPNDFEVGVQVVSSAFLGDVKILDRKEGGMMNHINIQSPFYSESSKKIKLIVSTFIGDVRVTKVG